MPSLIFSTVAGIRRRFLARLLTRMAHDNSGVIAVIVAILVPAFVALAALAIDMSYAYWTRTQLQHAATAAALAGATALLDADDNDVPDNNDYRDMAIRYAYLNMEQARHGAVIHTSCGIYDSASDIVAAGNFCTDVEVGNWAPAPARAFTARYLPNGTDNPAYDPLTMSLDAVSVETRRADANGNPLGLFLAAAVGLAQTDINTVAIAWSQGGVPSGRSCYEDGVLAGGEVTLGSDAVFVNNFCIYGREGVTFVSGPVIEEGTQIGALNSASCNPYCSDCGAQCGTINFESHECYVPRDTYLYMPPEDCDAACAAAHGGIADRLTWLQANGLCGPVESAISYGVDLQPEQANSISAIIDGIEFGTDRPPQITNVVIIDTPGTIPFQTEHPVTGVVQSFMGNTLPPPADIVPGTAYIFYGDFYVDNVIYDVTDIIIAVRGTAYFDGGALRNIAPCDGTQRYKLGFYATNDLYMRDVATGVDLIGGNDVVIGENFNEYEPGPHDVSIQAGNDVWTDESGQNLTCPGRKKSYGGPGADPVMRLVD